MWPLFVLLSSCMYIEISPTNQPMTSSDSTYHNTKDISGIKLKGPLDQQAISIYNMNNRKRYWISLTQSLHLFSTIYSKLINCGWIWKEGLCSQGYENSTSLSAEMDSNYFRGLLWECWPSLSSISGFIAWYGFDHQLPSMVCGSGGASLRSIIAFCDFRPINAFSSLKK